MLIQRLIVVIIFLPVGIGVFAAGGIPYLIVMAALLSLAGLEYAQLFRKGGYRPATALVVLGILGLAVLRFYDLGAAEGALLAAVVLAATTAHLVDYERGRDQAATDLAITLGGVLYIGWLGAYFFSLRALPEGKWWVLLTLPAIWFADGGAYLIGRQFGRRQLSRRLSPHKTWEGYLAGVVSGTLGTALLAALWRVGAGPDSLLTPGRGAILGLVLSVAAPLGDLGASMIKRQMGVKDSGRLFPGHGGALDRMDTWLWAVALGYHLILWMVP
jgi:phosphatidate cytidylyltransferase